MNWPVVGGVLATGSILAGSVLRARAGLQLTDAQRSQVMTVGAYRYAVRTILGLGLALWLFPAALLGLPVGSMVSWAMLLLPVPIAVWLHISYFRKLRALGLPAAYVRAHERTRYLVYTGCALGVGLAWFGSRVS
jgi:hypothetical protein